MAASDARGIRERAAEQVAVARDLVDKAKTPAETVAMKALLSRAEDTLRRAEANASGGASASPEQRRKVDAGAAGRPTSASSAAPGKKGSKESTAAPADARKAASPSAKQLSAAVSPQRAPRDVQRALSKWIETGFGKGATDEALDAILNTFYDTDESAPPPPPVPEGELPEQDLAKVVAELAQEEEQLAGRQQPAGATGVNVQQAHMKIARYISIDSRRMERELSSPDNQPPSPLAFSYIQPHGDDEDEEEDGAAGAEKVPMPDFKVISDRSMAVAAAKIRGERRRLRSPWQPSRRASHSDARPAAQAVSRAAGPCIASKRRGAAERRAGLPAGFRVQPHGHQLLRDGEEQVAAAAHGDRARD
jgi:hypothetical protein